MPNITPKIGTLMAVTAAKDLLAAEKLRPFLRINIQGEVNAIAILLRDTDGTPFYQLHTDVSSGYTATADLSLETCTMDGLGILAHISAFGQDRNINRVTLGMLTASNLLVAIKELTELGHDGVHEELMDWLGQRTSLPLVAGEITNEEALLLSLMKRPLGGQFFAVMKAHNIRVAFTISDIVATWCRGYAVVRKGEWDNYSDAQARKSFMPPYLVITLQREGLKLVTEHGTQR